MIQKVIANCADCTSIYQIGDKVGNSDNNIVADISQVESPRGLEYAISNSENKLLAYIYAGIPCIVELN